MLLNARYVIAVHDDILNLEGGLPGFAQACSVKLNDVERGNFLLATLYFGTTHWRWSVLSC